MLNTAKKLVKDVSNIISALATAKTVVDANKTLVNDIRAKLQGNYLLTDPALAVGTTATNVATGAIYFSIGGSVYYKAAVATGTAPGNDVVPSGKYGAVAFDIGADGTIDAIEATANATGYASAALAIAGIAACAADHVRIGTVTVTKSDGDFTFGTTELSAANVTAAYVDATTMFNAIGAAVSDSTPSAITQLSP